MINIAKTILLNQTLMNGYLDPYVDVYVYDRDEIELKLQITMGQSDLPGIFAKLRIEAKNSEKGYAVGEGKINSLDGLIEDVLIKKNYSSKVKNELILLVEHEYGAFDSESSKIIFRKFQTTEFKGLYIVTLPKTEEIYGSSSEGQIVAIKNYFGENCIVF